ADVTVLAERDGLPQAQLDDLLAVLVERPAQQAAAAVGQAAVQRLAGEAVARQDAGAEAVAGVGERHQQVRGTGLVGAEGRGGLDRVQDGLPGVVSEAFEHRGLRSPLRYGCYIRWACFWCTACRVTPSAFAIACQDQPRARALRTCTASRCSTSLRSAATARSPTLGSAGVLTARGYSAGRSMPDRRDARETLGRGSGSPGRPGRRRPRVEGEPRCRRRVRHRIS